MADEEEEQGGGHVFLLGVLRGEWWW